MSLPLEYHNDWKGKLKYLYDNGYFDHKQRILEIGAGDMQSTEWLSSHGIINNATDINGNLPYFDMDITVPDMKYDLIFGLGVLHHSRTPKETFLRLQKFADELVFIEPVLSPLHLLLAFQPIEMTRFRFFAAGFAGNRVKFANKYHMLIKQQVIHYKVKK